ncbi:MAG: capsular biosynthesis protein, partial [Magnetococcales bacterium]|nr:capsular biosynthesis protein [Magnetococcales bacterium]
LFMARMARADGTKTIVATPHVHRGKYDNAWPDIQKSAEKLRHALKEAEIDIEISAGGEIRYWPGLMGALKKGTMPLYNQGGSERYILLELSHGSLPAGALYGVEMICRAGYRPIIAHPERITSFKRQPRNYAPLAEMGCLAQITTASLTGGFGSGARKAAASFMEMGWVHVLASDGHGFYRRQPVLADGEREAARIVGEKRARAMVEDHPQAILKGERVSWSV